MIQYFCHYRAQATRHIISRASLRLPWAMNFCPFGACPSDRMPSPVMWHTTSSYFPPAKNPCRSAAPTARSVLLTSSPHGICAYLRYPWENNTFCLFFSALCAYLLPTDPADFHRFFAPQRPFRMRKIRGNLLRRRRIKNQAVGSGARVKNP